MRDRSTRNLVRTVLAWLAVIVVCAAAWPLPLVRFLIVVLGLHVLIKACLTFEASPRGMVQVLHNPPIPVDHPVSATHPPADVDD